MIITDILVPETGDYSKIEKRIEGLGFYGMIEDLGFTRLKLSEQEEPFEVSYTTHGHPDSEKKCMITTRRIDGEKLYALYKIEY